MTPDDVRALNCMPPDNPSYPQGPYRFFTREYLIITYETDPDAIRRLLPEPLEPDGSNTANYEWIKMPDSTGFGAYEETGIVIPCLLDGAPVNYTVMMFLNDEPPITAGREIWGFPKRWGEPRLEVVKDTLVGVLNKNKQLTAMGTMPYKWEDVMDPDPVKAAAPLGKTQINLKLIPCVTGKLRVAELVAYNMTDINVYFHYKGPARLHLVPHVSAPVADLPVRKVIGANHICADASLPYGRIVHDYLA
ncbi:MAG: acetoacetate decarboxylase [Pseudomonadota bacterium]